jgi:hypothetical protein
MQSFVARYVVQKAKNLGLRIHVQNAENRSNHSRPIVSGAMSAVQFYVIFVAKKS